MEIWLQYVVRSFAFALSMTRGDDVNVRAPCPEQYGDLKSWQGRQRQMFKKRQLRPVKVVILKVAGFVFDLYEDNWHRQFAAICKKGVVEKRQQHWAYTQFTNYKQGTLEADRQELLERVGLLKKDENGANKRLDMAAFDAKNFVDDGSGKHQRVDVKSAFAEISMRDIARCSKPVDTEWKKMFDVAVAHQSALSTRHRHCKDGTEEESIGAKNGGEDANDEEKEDEDEEDAEGKDAEKNVAAEEEEEEEDVENVSEDARESKIEEWLQDQAQDYGRGKLSDAQTALFLQLWSEEVALVARLRKMAEREHAETEKQAENDERAAENERNESDREFADRRLSPRDTSAVLDCALKTSNLFVKASRKKRKRVSAAADVENDPETGEDVEEKRSDAAVGAVATPTEEKENASDESREESREKSTDAVQDARSGNAANEENLSSSSSSHSFSFSSSKQRVDEIEKTRKKPKIELLESMDLGTRPLENLALCTLQRRFKTRALTHDLFEILKQHHLEENPSELIKLLTEPEKAQFLKVLSFGQRSAMRSVFGMK